MEKYPMRLLDNHGKDLLDMNGRYAQSFKPILSTLTKVKILLEKKGSPGMHYMSVYLRDALDTSPLEAVTIYPADISSGKSWVEIDFDDVSITPGQTYYIDIYTMEGDVTPDPNNFIKWRGNHPDPYANGKAWHYSPTSYNWYPITIASSGPLDFCFKTYGILENQPPNKPTCSYDRSKDEIVVFATDLDEDQLRYGVSWDNDGSVDEWTNYVNSGTQKRIYCEGRTGTVGVIAEDINGAQSGWAFQKPKVKGIYFNSLMPWIFDNHPNIFSMLKLLIQRIYIC
jgi:hypothetical protein